MEQNMWKNMFTKLFRNNDPNPNEMWSQFHISRLSKEDIINCFKDESKSEFSDAKAKLTEIHEGTQELDINAFVNKMQDEPTFDDNTWKFILFSIRDRKSRSLDMQKTIPVIKNGHQENLNISDLEQIFLEEHPDLLITQTCVPEYLGTEDMEHLNTQGLQHKLKTMFDSRVQENLGQKDMSKMKEAEVNNFKHSSEKQALADLKKTWEAKMLQKQQADRAEAIVQEAIYKAARKYGIVLTVLRGIKTYQHVGQFLKDLGIECSKFGNLVKAKEDSEPETEHDIAVVGILSTGLFVSFIQVSNCKNFI